MFVGAAFIERYFTFDERMWGEIIVQYTLSQTDQGLLRWVSIGSSWYGGFVSADREEGIRAVMLIEQLHGRHRV